MLQVRFAALAATSLMLLGCASAEHRVKSDPLEPMNRTVYRFNDAVDRAALKPAAKAYVKYTPDWFRTGVGNFFTNLSGPTTIVTQLLQGKVVPAGQDTLRFVINTTLGWGGLFDVASGASLPQHNEDSGPTLGRWGVPAGPYLVLPLMPPLTVRDGIGTGVDGAMHPLYYYIPFFPDAFGMRVGDTVNDRSLNLDLFQGIEESTVDLYSSVRNGYLQRRNRMIKEGK